MKKIMMLAATVCATLNMNANVIDTDQFNNINVVDTTFHLNPDSSRVALKHNRYLFEEEQTKSKVLSASTPSEWGLTGLLVFKQVLPSMLASLLVVQMPSTAFLLISMCMLTSGSHLPLVYA